MKKTEIARAALSIMLGTVGLLCFTVQETPNSLLDVKVVLIGILLLMSAKLVFPKDVLNKMQK